jgi:hypothetical protein
MRKRTFLRFPAYCEQAVIIDYRSIQLNINEHMNSILVLYNITNCIYITCIIGWFKRRSPGSVLRRVADFGFEPYVNDLHHITTLALLPSIFTLKNTLASEVGRICIAILGLSRVHMLLS